MSKSIAEVAAYQDGLERLEKSAREVLARELTGVDLTNAGMLDAVIELVMTLCDAFGESARAAGEAWAVACMPGRDARADLSSLPYDAGIGDKARDAITKKVIDVLDGAAAGQLDQEEARGALGDVVGNHLATVNRNATLSVARELQRQTGPDDVDLTITSPENQLVTFLEAAFEPGEYVSIVTAATKQKNGRWSPSYRNSDKTAAELIDEITNNGVEKTLHPNRQAGAWVGVNPVTQGGTGKADVTSYRHTLIECDTGDKAKQLEALRNSGLPISALVDSGNKSIHAWVRVDAESEEEFKKRRDTVVKYCQDLGLDVDTRTSSPANLARLPGVPRGGEMQELLDVDLGPETWDEFVDEYDITEDARPRRNRASYATRRTSERKRASSVRYVRVPRPDCRCAFCLMMGSRGAYSIGTHGSYGSYMTNESFGYRSAKSAGGKGFVNSLGDQGYHADCRCVVVPLESAADVLEGYEAYTDDWYTRYRAAYTYVTEDGHVSEEFDKEYEQRVSTLENDDDYHKTLIAMRLMNKEYH